MSDDALRAQMIDAGTRRLADFDIDSPGEVCSRDRTRGRRAR